MFPSNPLPTIAGSPASNMADPLNFAENFALSGLAAVISKVINSEIGFLQTTAHNVRICASSPKYQHSNASYPQTVAAPIERVKLLVQNQDEMIKQGRLDKPYGGVIDCTKRTFA